MLEPFDFQKFRSITSSFFFILDSLGVIPIVAALLKPYPLQHQRKIILREMAIAIAVMLLTLAIGQQAMQLFAISDSSLHFAGGIVLFFTAMMILFPKPLQSADLSSEPFIVPIAIPLIAGAGIIAKIIAECNTGTPTPLLISAILLSGALSTLVLLLIPFIIKYLGTTFISFIERLMGVIVLLLALGSILQGVKLF
jgi:multiple antibiotic resistance protein